ncbi:ATP-dependent RNA ligase [Methanonatronarchaeum thermophilum]|uniref:ATP-dependent RNA ligase n=1 Tax=Methanonatronarchaeum thermophilum TaxID=1927129 RepID=A0A1Y3GB94_9EURY|nr:RNA ligase [Methanonatronarchaeum thermophilum]OUJ18698.1 ATP-dependent RNA ligase [Methanonatronarchaeum thermophilum]
MKDNLTQITEKNLNINREKIQEGLKKQIIIPEKNHYRFNKTWGGIQRGTTIFKDGSTIHGFPKIRRAMLLKPTIKKHFKDFQKITIEEKMNGYNVRAAITNNKIVGLTRSGLICPYTTAKLEEKIGYSFFKENPNLVLCGEMIGPDNPYVPKNIYNVESVDFVIFDIMEKQTADFLKLEQRQKLTDKYGLKNVPNFGQHHPEQAHKKAREIIKKLSKEKREGILIKHPEHKKPPIKYTTSQSNCSDLEFAYRYYNDYGSDFVHSRVVREGFQSYEWREQEQQLEERAKRLGKSILKSIKKTIKERNNNEKTTEEVSIKIKELRTAEKFKKHLEKQAVEFEVKDIEELNDGYRVHISKVMRPTNDKTKSLLNGDLW